jgi:hypothetical protein
MLHPGHVLHYVTADRGTHLLDEESVVAGDLVEPRTAWVPLGGAPALKLGCVEVCNGGDSQRRDRSVAGGKHRPQASM